LAYAVARRLPALQNKTIQERIRAVNGPVIPMNGESVFRIQRYFSVTGLLSILFAAQCLLRFTATSRPRHRAAGRGAKYRLGGYRAQLRARRLGEVFDLSAAATGRTRRPARSPTLQNEIDDLMEDNPAVVGIKIYNRAGTIVFSTKPSQMGATRRTVRDSSPL
jgi:hypothetical protein